MKAKEKEAQDIENEISETKKLLNKLRYAVVSNYYNIKSRDQRRDLEFNSILHTCIEESDQIAIHPSLKKLIAKKPIIYSGKTRETRTLKNAAQNEIKLSEKDFKSDLETCGSIDTPKVVSTTSDNKVICLTSTRGRNQLKHTLIVGNTSQYVYKEDSASNITHKWMCYLLAKSKVPIERLVQKVIFCLDSSYQPNDMIEVTSSPFQITRRGYGEFQIKLIIFFRDEVQLKPIQIYHRLRLDNKFKGLQTLGNETVSELWTRDFLTSADNDQRDSNRETSSKLEILPDLAEDHHKHNHLIDHDYFQSNDISHAKPVQKIRKISRYADTKTIKGEVMEKVSKEDVVKWLKDFTKISATNVSNAVEYSTNNEDKFAELPENHDLEMI